jgi:hypothetical protein
MMSSLGNSKSAASSAGPEQKLTDEEWKRRRTYVREAIEQWRRDHPEEVEAARLKEENARLEYELSQAEAREAKAARTRRDNRHFTVRFAVYLGGGFLLWMLFSDTCPSCAWNGSPTTSGWDFLAMFALLGWSIGGIPVSDFVATQLCWRYRGRA